MTATADVPQADPELQAEFAALQALAQRHRREYIRLRTIELARLSGTVPRFTRHRMTREELAQLPPVTDSTGAILEPDMRVRCPDGVHARVVRVDRRSRRAVVARKDGLQKMTVASKLTILGSRRANDASADSGSPDEASSAA